MTISLDTMLRHMKWANQQIFSHISQLPDEALNSFVTKSDWQVSQILMHIVGAADKLVFRLNQRPFSQVSKPQTMQDVKELAKKLAKYDDELIELGKLSDQIIEINREGEISHWQASTILSQAVHHVIEHRCQAVTALEFKGFKAPDLDDYDVWGYELSTK
ncbi:MAG: DinB family protein [Candidatus Nanopelagicaceae bacterium]|jgi:uncharacterized damage-inducible protein DinB